MVLAQPLLPHGSRLAPTLGAVSGHLRLGTSALAVVVRALVSARAPEGPGKTFPAQPQLQTHGRQEQMLLLPTPCLQLCLPSPRAWARPPGCHCSCFLREGYGVLAEGENSHSSSQGSRKVSTSPYPPGLADDGGTEPQGSKGQVRPCTRADQPPP